MGRMLSVLIFFPPLLFADPLTVVNRFLASAQLELDRYATGAQKAPVADQGLGNWIEETQVRLNTEHDLGRSDDNNQSYEIRIKPKAWGQREAEQTLLSLRSQQEDAQIGSVLNSELNRRYLVALDLIAQHQQTHLAFQTYDLLQQQLQYNRSLVDTEQFDAADLLDAEVAFEQARDAANLHIARLQRLQERFSLSPDTETSLRRSAGNWDWLIDVEHIERIMTGTDGIPEAPKIRESRLALAEAKAEFERRRTQQQLGVNLLSVQIDDDHTSDPSLGFLVGFNIPLGKETYQNTLARHDVYDAHLKLHDSKYIVRQSIEEQRAKMQWLLEEWRMAQKQVAQLGKHLQQSYAQFNPRLGLNLRLAHNKKREELFAIQEKARSLYVHYLTTTGRLISKPLRNWLHVDLAELSTEINANIR